MFNIVDLNKNCPVRGEKVEWQTKGLVLDGMYPIENGSGVFELTERISGEIYTRCEECGFWSEVIVKNGKLGRMKTRKEGGYADLYKKGRQGDYQLY